PDCTVEHITSVGCSVNHHWWGERRSELNWNAAAGTAESLQYGTSIKHNHQSESEHYSPDTTSVRHFIWRERRRPHRDAFFVCSHSLEKLKSTLGKVPTCRTMPRHGTLSSEEHSPHHVEFSSREILGLALGYKRGGDQRSWN